MFFTSVGLAFYDQSLQDDSSSNAFSNMRLLRVLRVAKVTRALRIVRRAGGDRRSLCFVEDLLVFKGWTFERMEAYCIFLGGNDFGNQFWESIFLPTQNIKRKHQRGDSQNKTNQRKEHSMQTNEMKMAYSHSSFVEGHTPPQLGCLMTISL